MMEKTFVAIKPDGVKRGLVGKIVQRFEDVGLRIIGMKLVWVDEEFAKKHYREDIAEKHGKHVRDWLMDLLTSGPVIAMVLEGVEAIALVRKMVGATEPKSAAPGTIRGDFTHVSYGMADAQKKAIPNVIHASADQADVDIEIPLWFNKEEMHSYRTVHEEHTHLTN